MSKRAAHRKSPRKKSRGQSQKGVFLNAKTGISPKTINVQTIL